MLQQRGIASGIDLYGDKGSGNFFCDVPATIDLRLKAATGRTTRGPKVHQYAFSRLCCQLTPLFDIGLPLNFSTIGPAC
jgi:hypothetical protein|tara:strand:- start:264 stop:500 length:237 start_codon:yes stop_codon:yes gene_type:complete